MKQIIAIVLLLLLISSAYAEEVTLKCDVRYKSGTQAERIWRFDEVKLTVRVDDDKPMIANGECEGHTKEKSCMDYFITETHIGSKYWTDGKYYDAVETRISRMDGKYTGYEATGTCVPFKKAF